MPYFRPQWTDFNNTPAHFIVFDAPESINEQFGIDFQIKSDVYPNKYKVYDVLSFLAILRLTAKGVLVYNYKS